MFSPKIVLLVALFGAAGAVSRYSVSMWAGRWFGQQFPWGTLLVNLGGCFLLGLLVEWTASASVVSEAWRIGIAAGFMGSLTTFSTFSFETFQLLQRGEWSALCTNVAANFLLGIAAVWLGCWVGDR